MKYFVLISVVLATAYGLDQEFIDKVKAKMHVIGEECAKESGTTEADIAEIKAMQAPSRQEGKCFIACFQKKLGVMNADGKLDKAGGIASMDKFKGVDDEFHDKAVKILEKCYDSITDEDDKCDTALNFVICLKMTAKEVGFSTEMFS